jgi:hypothetical protein
MFMARVYASVKQVDSNWACKNRNCKAEALSMVWTPVPGANDAELKPKILVVKAVTAHQLAFGMASASASLVKIS